MTTCITCLAHGDCAEHEPPSLPVTCTICRKSEAIAMCGPEPVCSRCLDDLRHGLAAEKAVA